MGLNKAPHVYALPPISVSLSVAWPAVLRWKGDWPTMLMHPPRLVALFHKGLSFHT